MKKTKSDLKSIFQFRIEHYSEHDIHIYCINPSVYSDVSTLNQFRRVSGMPDYSWDLMRPHTDVINTPIISDCDLENGTQSGIGSHSRA